MTKHTHQTLSAEQEKFEKLLKDFQMEEYQFSIMDKYPTDTEQYHNALERDRKILADKKKGILNFILASNARIRLQTLQEVQGMIEGEKRKENVVPFSEKITVNDQGAIDDIRVNMRVTFNDDKSIHNSALYAIADKLSALIINEK